MPFQVTMNEKETKKKKCNWLNKIFCWNSNFWSLLECIKKGHSVL